MAIACVMLLGVAAGAAAQEPRRGTAALDVNRLPVDVDRIGRELRQATVTEERGDGLNLRYRVEVFGRPPDIQLFTPEDNLTNGPVPYGAPTHRQMIEQITPQEYRAPVMDFNALVRWLAGKAKSGK